VWRKEGVGGEKKRRREGEVAAGAQMARKDYDLSYLPHQEPP
jgi:hypothetical protein